MQRSGGSFMQRPKRLTANKGTTLVEYGLILLLIAIVVVVMVKLVGESTNKMWTIVNTEVTKAGN